MGNYKFRFSDMIPNAWFHKLKDMNKPRSTFPKTKPLNPTNNKHSSSPLPSSRIINPSSEFTKQQQPPPPHQRKSYYFTRDFTPDSPIKSALSVPEPPRKSSRRRRSTRRSRPRLVSSSAGCSCRAAVWAKHDDSPPSPEECTNSGRDQSSSSEPDSVPTEYASDDRGSAHYSMASWSSPCKCGAKSNDIVIDIDNSGGAAPRLAPIITKKSEPTKIQRAWAEFSETNAYGSLSVKVVKDDFVTATAAASQGRRSGMKLRVNSPRIGNRRAQGRRSVSSSNSSSAAISDSVAVVKASKDPRRDFRESMVEMILENNIRASNDLEELLACYLSLNSDQYHDLIINVFKQIWFDFLHLRLK